MNIAEAAIIIELRRIVYRLDAIRIALEDRGSGPALEALAARLDAERDKLARTLIENTDSSQ